MKERPILFSSPMIRALLDGSKTQTRRIIKNVPMFFGDEGNTADGYAGDYVESLLCPYGDVGAQLWVRETWYCDHYLVQRGPFREVEGAKEMLVYRADNPRPYEAEQPIWRPSIFLPRWASRIQLEITCVRVERLNSISEVDALAEGAEAHSGWVPTYNNPDNAGCSPEASSAKEEYIEIWESINGEGSWPDNPWVWVIEFKQVAKPQSSPTIES